MADLPNTPGAWGYLLAVVVSVLTMPTLLVAPGMLWAVAVEGAGLEALAVAPLYWLYVAWMTGVFATPLACVGVAIVHLTCRASRSQRMHVVVTGAVTMGVVLGAAGLIGELDRDSEVVVLLASLAAVSTMVGRAVVVPLVVLRRERAGRRTAAGRRTNPA